MYVGWHWLKCRLEPARHVRVSRVQSLPLSRTPYVATMDRENQKTQKTLSFLLIFILLFSPATVFLNGIPPTHFTQSHHLLPVSRDHTKMAGHRPRICRRGYPRELRGWVAEIQSLLRPAPCSGILTYACQRGITVLVYHI